MGNRHIRIATRAGAAFALAAATVAGVVTATTPTAAAAASAPQLVVTTGVVAADPVLVGAGDIATSGSGDSATAALLDNIAGTVFTAGDNAYPDGTAANFNNYYAPTWGRHKARTKPTPGNHDYHTAGASGYFNYFGAAAGDPSKGYYSYALGSWKVFALNSNCSKIGGCGAGSPQERWLRSQLAANTKPCIAAIWHHARFSSGQHGNNTVTAALVKALYDYRSDMILVGHDHTYERFAQLNPSGALDTANGARHFVAGMGGASHYSWGTIKPNSQARNNNTFGVLKLTLHASSYAWQFVPQAGKTYTDSGTTACH